MKRFKNNISPDCNYKQKASPRSERERPSLYVDVSVVTMCVLLFHQHFDGLVAYLDDCH